MILPFFNPHFPEKSNFRFFFRRKLLEEKEAELKSQADKLNAKAKRELEALRQRFRIMQSAGALERSPSASESELSMEVQSNLS